MKVFKFLVYALMFFNFIMAILHIFKGNLDFGTINLILGIWMWYIIGKIEEKNNEG